MSNCISFGLQLIAHSHMLVLGHPCQKVKAPLLFHAICLSSSKAHILLHYILLLHTSLTISAKLQQLGLNPVFTMLEIVLKK